MIDSKIGWTDDTLNFWWGCEKVSPACKFCYAERVAHHFKPSPQLWGPGSERWLRVENGLRDLARIRRLAVKEGRPRRVFIQSMSDIAEERPDLAPAQAEVFRALNTLDEWVVPMLLTKRPAHLLRLYEQHGLPPHVWVLTTLEDCNHSDRLDALRNIPAAVHGVSAEPLLGDVSMELAGYIHDLQWVIAGGESGPEARASHPDWFRALRDLCKGAQVPFFFKQWGEWLEIDLTTARRGDLWLCPRPTLATRNDGLLHTQRWKPGDAGAEAGRWARYADRLVRNVGVKTAGNTLDNLQWEQLPAFPTPPTDKEIPA